MKSTLVVCIAVLATLAVPYSAEASLGGDIKSVQADRVFMRATLKSTVKSNYSVLQIQAPNGVVVREYASPTGSVFGVAWQGPTRPDLRQILGPYFFDTYSEAVKQEKTRTFIYVRGPMRIEENGLVVEMGGHMRWYFGRAYVQQMMPSGVTAKEIR